MDETASEKRGFFCLDVRLRVSCLNKLHLVNNGAVERLCGVNSRDPQAQICVGHRKIQADRVTAHDCVHFTKALHEYVSRV